MHYGISTPLPGVSGEGVPKVHGRWALYVEKFITAPALDKNRYDQKKPLEWLQSIRDYVAGRSDEIDPLLDWVEAQTEPITTEMLTSNGNLPMINGAPTLKEASRQFWALLNPLLADSSVSNNFCNVQRHNGLEAWRMLAEPINEDKMMVQKELLASVTNPEPANSLDAVDGAITDWDTNIRLFVKACGTPPADSVRRISLIQMLPMDVSAYITMHIRLT